MSTLKLNKSSLSVLAAVINATNSDVGFEYVVENAPAVKVLIEAGLIEVNPTDAGVNAEGERQARVTQVGRDYAATGEFAAAASDAQTEAQGGQSFGSGQATEGQANEAQAKPAKGKKPNVSIAKGIEMPGRTRAPSAAKYPFDALEIGDSFFIADSEVANGDAYKTMASTISGTNARYSEETGETRPNRKDASKTVAVRRQLRQFEHRRWTEEGVTGARVWRVEVDTDSDDNSEE